MVFLQVAVVKQRDMRFFFKSETHFLTSFYVVVLNTYQLHSACTGYN